MKLVKNFALIFVLVLNCSSMVYAARVTGIVTDASTGEPLLGATVVLGDQNRFGTITDQDGRFTFVGVPEGEIEMRVTYIGYQTDTRTINVTSDDVGPIRISLQVQAIQGEEVVITALARGQLGAINQQLTSDAFVNVVDAARIQELPDQNAAEAIGRLPGVMVTRNNGEGAGVGIRGLAPQYNQIQLDGVTMGSAPSMGRVNDYSHGRGVDLSSIAQENLSGIELYKTVTPDMDAATLGGTVNLRLGKASNDTIYQVRGFGSYNQYVNDWNQYRVMGRLSRRFFDSKLGVQLSGNSEKRNRGSDRLSANIQKEDVYQPDGSRLTRFITDNATIRNIRNIRYKHSANAILDYKLFGVELLFSNFYTWGSSRSQEIARTEGRLNGNETDSKNYSLSNSLRATHDLLGFEFDWQLSRYSTKTETPYDYSVFIAQINQSSMPPGVQDLDPEEWLLQLPNDGEWIHRRTDRDSGYIAEVQYTGKLDITRPFFFNKISGFIKFGGKYRRINRESYIYHQTLGHGRFPSGNGPDISYFDTDYNADPVLNGQTKIVKYIEVDGISDIWDDWIKDWHLADPQPLNTPNNNYDIQENYFAGYFMLKASAFRNLLTLIAGIRYEGSEFDANGNYMWTSSSSTTNYQGIVKPVNANRSEGFWLPNVHLKIKPTEWFDSRLSVTKTISRPNYRYRIPYTTVSFNTDGTTALGNPDLKTAESLNYDWSNSFYHSNFGLFTLSLFYKEIDNFAFRYDDYIANDSVALEFGFEEGDPAFDAGHYSGKEVNTWKNTHGTSTVKGIEIDYQANLRNISWMPRLLRNITFRINYTRAWSDSWLRQYSVTLDSIAYLPGPPYVVEYNTYNTGFRKGRLLTQPDHILNTTIGYQIGGFSGMFTVSYQGRSLRGNARVEPNDSYVEGFLRYDFSLRYRVGDHLSFLVSGVNIGNEPDISSLSGTDRYSTYSVYGAMYDFGIQYDF